LLISVSDTWSRTVNSKGFRGTVLPGIFTQEQAQAQIANPYIATLSATWTLRPNMINEASFGTQSNQETFGIGFNIDLFKPQLLNFPLSLPSGLEERNGQGFGNTFSHATIRFTTLWTTFIGSAGYMHLPLAGT